MADTAVVCECVYERVIVRKYCNCPTITWWEGVLTLAPGIPGSPARPSSPSEPLVPVEPGPPLSPTAPCVQPHITTVNGRVNVVGVRQSDDRGGYGHIGDVETFNGNGSRGSHDNSGTNREFIHRSSHGDDDNIDTV